VSNGEGWVNVRKFLLLFSILVLFISSGCETLSPSSNHLPSPEPNHAIIHGKLLSPANDPVKDMSVRLAMVYRFDDEEGTFILDDAQSPSATSDENGDYVFLNIIPGEYVLFIGSIHINYKIVSETDDIPIVYEVGPGETLKIEPVIVDFD
jgi:hypothetical protein